MKQSIKLGSRTVPVWLIVVSVVLAAAVGFTLGAATLHIWLRSNPDDHYTTEFLYDRTFTIAGKSRKIVNINGTGEMIYLKYKTNNPTTSVLFFCDGKGAFLFQIRWEYEVSGRRGDTPMAQILRYDTENDVYVAQIVIPFQFRENFTIAAYVSDASTAEIDIGKLVLALAP